MTRPEYEFYVTSMVASKTGKPAVTVTVNGADFTVNMSVDEARDLAFNLLGAAEAAEGDAFLVNFIVDKVEVPPEQAAGILIDFREYREGKGKR